MEGNLRLYMMYSNITHFIMEKICYSTKTMQELKLICKENKLKGISRKNKKELVEFMETMLSPSLHISEVLLETDINNTGGQTNDVMQPSQPLCSLNMGIYTKELLKEQYLLHKNYVKGRIDTTIKIGIKVRLPAIPEDISENIIKQIINNKLNDPTSSWNCKNGDLYSTKEGKQECKCFTSDGPISFTPTSEWDVIYFLDSRKWLNDEFVLYRVPLKRTSEEWKIIKINKLQTFEEQSAQKRRPRIGWDNLKPQLKNHCIKVFEGTFEDIFEDILF